MKYGLYFLLLSLIFCIASASAQSNYAVDAEPNLTKALDTSVLEHWFVKGKYPESSERLVLRANEALSKVKAPEASGYITYRMIIGVDGVLQSWELLQSDNSYMAVQFSAELVDALYHFVKDLKGWRKGIYEKRAVQYRTYLSFKIHNGHVLEVSP